MKNLVLYLLLIIAIPVAAQPGHHPHHSSHATENHHHHSSHATESHHHPGPMVNAGHHAHPTPPHEIPGMNPKDYDDAVRIISNETFDDRRLTTAKRIITVNPMSVHQIAGICRLFTFEANRLEFAKYAYFHCVDPNNYFLLDEVFTFKSSKDELFEFIWR